MRNQIDSEVVVVGAGGHSKVVSDVLFSMGVVPLHQAKELSVIIAVGDNGARKIIADTELPDKQFFTAIHPSAIVARSAAIGDGSMVMHGSVIQPGVTIGRHCIINTSAVVDHDCALGDYVHVSPHATLCGSVSVGDGTHIGAGATVIQGVKIGKWCIIGAGAVVVRDIPDGSKAVGVPAKII